MPFSGSVQDACRVLYAQDPATFTQRRTELAAETDDAELRAAITALRKPTLPAWIVNAHVAAEPDAVGTLTDLGDRLRSAHADLDSATMRELSLERRRVVAEMTSAALQGSDRTGASQSVRDDVTATFDAAVADPDIAERLGTLQKPEHWSGFGVAVTGLPGLTLVPPTRPAGRARKAGKPAPQPPPVDEQKQRRLREAQEAFDVADEQWSTHQQDEEGLTQRIRRLTTKISTMQHDLEQARRDLDTARAQTRKARQARRTARSALDRAERSAGQD